MFNKSIYINRRQALLENLRESGATGIVVFMGNVDAPAQYKDNCYKFRQDSTWLYYFGIDEPRFAAIIDLDSGDQTLYADDYEIDDIIWMGPMPSVRSIADSAGIGKTASYGAFSIAVMKALSTGRDVHFIPASRYYQQLKYERMGLEKPSELLIKAIIKQRLVKSEEEIVELDAAATLGQEMHTIARRGIRIGEIEQKIVGDMEGFALSKGWGISFATILTQHGEIFHCHTHENVIEPGKLMVIDAGLESNSHYASDFTRTYPTGGHYTSRQRDIYNIVHSCNEFAFSMIKPGVQYRDIHLAVNRKMLEDLSALGLVKGDIDNLVEAGAAGLFMPHGLGHNMGLDVHDMEDLGEDFVGYDDDQTRSALLGLRSLRMARRLVPGNVITDEPGIYFIPALIDKWEKEGKFPGGINYSALREHYFDFGGIRLEDDVLVKADGARRLGAKRLPISVEDVEAAMENDRK